MATPTRIADEIRDVYEHEGPFATVYLDASRDTESGGHAVELRWREARAELERAGAPEAVLGALDGVAGSHTDVPGRHGQLMVASADGVLLDRRLPQPPAQTDTAWAALPHLMPYFAGRGPSVAHVVVRTDRTGADIDTVAASPDAGSRHDSVEGTKQAPVHKTARNDWSERHFQLRVENNWTQNAKDVAAAVRRHVGEVSAELVVVAGEAQARSLLHEQLRAELRPSVEIVEVSGGGRAEGIDQEGFEAQVHDALLRHGWRRRRELLAHLQQNLGRREYAVAGVADVLDTVRRSQADTVVVSDDPTSTLTAWIGPQPLLLGLSPEELRDLGVTEPQEVRFDAALVRAVVGSGAQLLVTPNAHEYVRDGIAALLRYADRSTPSA